MKDLLYDQSSLLIAAVLFLLAALTIEIGYYIGRRTRIDPGSSLNQQVNAIEGALLGVLGLMLAFTLSQSLQRFDSRSEAVVDEANRIGTVALRAQLLPASVREKVNLGVRRYLDLRVKGGAIELTREAERQEIRTQAAKELESLWSYACQAAIDDDRVTTTGYFIVSLNELIDSFGRREAALRRHVPDVFLLVVFVSFILAGSVIGYAAGLSRKRVALPTYMMITLLVLLIFIIIDLDRPRRGLIRVNQISLIELKASLDGPPHTP